MSTTQPVSFITGNCLKAMCHECQPWVICAPGSVAVHPSSHLMNQSQWLEKGWNCIGVDVHTSIAHTCRIGAHVSPKTKCLYIFWKHNQCVCHLRSATFVELPKFWKCGCWCPHISSRLSQGCIPKQNLKSDVWRWSDFESRNNPGSAVLPQPPISSRH